MAPKTQQLERQVLTLYCERGGFDTENPYDTGGFVRGIAALNGWVHDIMHTNPGIVVHSVSHSNLIQPGIDAERSILWLLATIVYSGEITNIERFEVGNDDSPDEKKHDLQEGYPAYGTVIRVLS